MRITLLGTGGPRPDPNRQGPATLVTSGGLRLLLDAGRGVATQLAKAGVRTWDLDAVFITHHHFDHIGGLGDLIMAAWNNERDRPLIIHGPPGTGRIVDALFDDVYRQDIAFRMAEARHVGWRLEHPRAMVEMGDIIDGHLDLGNGVQVAFDRVEHGSRSLELAAEQWTALGYRITQQGSVATISGDAVSCHELLRLAADAAVLVMCAYLAADEITSDDEVFLVEQILSGAPQAAAVAAEAGVQGLVLTHIREKSDTAIERMVEQVTAAFDGDVTAGRDLMTFDV